MSHFSVLVIGDDVERQLAPFHEFECTGRDDEYVQTVDETEEARAEYGAAMYARFRDPDGSLHDPYDDRFYRDPTPAELTLIGPLAGTGGNGRISWTSKDWNDGRGYRTKVHQMPDGWERVTVPAADVKSFLAWATDWYGREILIDGEEPDFEKQHKYGWIAVRRVSPPTSSVALGIFHDLEQESECGGTVPSEFDGLEVVGIFDRTNPNKQWDWWVEGGRWRRYLRLKPEIAARREQLVRDGLEDPWATPGEFHKEGGPDYLRANHALKGEVDFQAMRDDAAAAARERWQSAQTAIAGRPVPHWKRMVGEDPTPEHVEAMRGQYRADPVVKALAQAGFSYDVDQFDCTEEEYADKASGSAFLTFAVVKESTWYERGKMGWWGIVLDDKDVAEWGRQFSALVDSLPDDTLLTVVDCHI